MSDLRELGDQVLLQKTRELAKKEREITTCVLHHLREVERRRLFVDLGYKSLFEYAVGDLHYSGASAQNRISAMRLLKVLPELEEKIESGSLTLSVLSQAQRFFRAEAKVEKPLATEEKRKLLSVLEGKSCTEAERELLSRSSDPLALKPERVRAVSQTHSELKVVVSQETLDELERIKGLLGHVHSELSFGELIALMAKMTLEKLDPARAPKRTREPKRAPKHAREPNPTREAKQPSEPKSFAEPQAQNPKAIKPKQPTNTQASQLVSAQKPTETGVRRYIHADLKREVWTKSHSKCQNCGGYYRLQIDHITLIARGGTNAPENLRLLCFHCNQREADLKIGREKMESYRQPQRAHP